MKNGYRTGTLIYNLKHFFVLGTVTHNDSFTVNY